MKKFLMLFWFGAILIVTLSSCQSDQPENSDDSETEIVEIKKSENFTDPRDGTSYPTVQIGDQIWFTSNLKIKTDSSWAFQQSHNTPDRFGRLYVWNQAINACPDGWHLPSQKEWETLAKHYSDAQNLENNGDQNIYYALHEGGESRLNLSLSGFYNSATERVVGLGKHGSYWTSDKFGLEAGMCALMTLNDFGGGYFMFTPGSQDAGHACRCVKD